MATTGLEVFDRTLHTTNLWLDEINAEIGPDRHLAWHVLGAVLRSIRDEMQVEQSAHFAAQLPLLVRGAYFDQYRPAVQPASDRSQEQFMARIQRDLDGSRPVNAEQAAAVVMRTLNRHITEGQVKKVRDSLPKGVRAMWPEPEHSDPGRPESGRKEPEHAKTDQQQKSDQGAKSAGPARAAGQPSPGGQQEPQQPSESRHAAPPPPPHAAPPPSPPHAPPKSAAPEQGAPQRPAPRGAPPPAPPQHAAAQTSLHPAPNRPAREWEEIEEVEIVEVDDETPSIARSSSSKSPHAPIGAASRPAGVQSASPEEQTTSDRKPKTRGKRKDD
jgi:uncharacterized protein (DUF2267 family)